MGIFSDIKDAIFNAASSVKNAVESVIDPSAEAAPADAAAPAADAAAQPVDIEAVLDKMLSDSGRDLNWRTSIVDLMSLVGIDPSLDHRKQLAGELNYDGDTDDTATMNIWLHKQVMDQLAANGGKVPADLTA